MIFEIITLSDDKVVVCSNAVCKFVAVVIGAAEGDCGFIGLSGDGETVFGASEMHGVVAGEGTGVHSGALEGIWDGSVDSKGCSDTDGCPVGVSDTDGL